MLENKKSISKYYCILSHQLGGKKYKKGEIVEMLKVEYEVGGNKTWWADISRTDNPFFKHSYFEEKYNLYFIDMKQLRCEKLKKIEKIC